MLTYIDIHVYAFHYSVAAQLTQPGILKGRMDGGNAKLLITLNYLSFYSNFGSISEKRITSILRFKYALNFVTACQLCKLSPA